MKGKFEVSLTCLSWSHVQKSSLSGFVVSQEGFSYALDKGSQVWMAYKSLLDIFLRVINPWDTLEGSLNNVLRKVSKGLLDHICLVSRLFLSASNLTTQLSVFSLKSLSRIWSLGLFNCTIFHMVSWPIQQQSFAWSLSPFNRMVFHIALIIQ